MALEDRKPYRGLQRAVTWTRFLVYIPIVSLFIGAVALIIVGGVETVGAVYRALLDGTVSEKESLVDFISLADLFLLATVLYIIALGLYELFIDGSLPLPQWLIVRDLDDLKEKLAGVVVVVLSVFFLGFVVKATNPTLVMWEGIGIAAMIGALSLFLWTFGRGKHGGSAEPPQAFVAAMEAEIEREVVADVAQDAKRKAP